MIQILSRYGVLFILTLLVLTAMSFSLVYLFPGDVLENLTGIVPQNEIQREALMRQFRLDQPYVVQFFLLFIVVTTRRLGLQPSVRSAPSRRNWYRHARDYRAQHLCDANGAFHWYPLGILRRAEKLLYYRPHY